MNDPLQYLEHLVGQINNDETDAAFWPRVVLSDDTRVENGALQGGIVLSLTRGNEEIYAMTESLNGAASPEEVEDRLSEALSRFLALQTEGKAGRGERQP